MALVEDLLEARLGRRKDVLLFPMEVLEEHGYDLGLDFNSVEVDSPLK